MSNAEINDSAVVVSDSAPTGTAAFSTDNEPDPLRPKADSVDTADPPEEAMLY
jgi:hypothetical protein